MSKIKLFVALLALFILVSPAFSFSENAIEQGWNKKIDCFQEDHKDGKEAPPCQDDKKVECCKDGYKDGKEAPPCQDDKKIECCKDGYKDGKEAPPCQDDKKIDGCDNEKQVKCMMGMDSPETQHNVCDGKHIKSMMEKKDKDKEPCVKTVVIDLKVEQ